MRQLRQVYLDTGCDRWLGWTFVLSMSAIFSVAIPMPLSRSGSLTVTAADFTTLGAWLVLVWLMVGRRWRPTSTARWLLIAVGVFSIWFAVITLLRFFRGDEVLQPLLVVRTTLLPVAAYLLLAAGLESRTRALGGLVVFEVLLNLWHLAEWNNMRMSDFLGNSIVYGGLLVVLLPVNVFLLTGSRMSTGPALRAAAALNIVAALVFPVWSGSRGPTALAALIGILCFVAVARRRGVALVLVASASIALAAHVFVWFANPQGAASGIYRLVPPPALVGAERPDFVSELETEQRETAVIEMSRSDASRADLAEISFESFAESPIIGNGVVYFDWPGDGETKEYAAHNLVLEHLNAFAGPGFLLYLAILLIPVLPLLARLRRDDAERLPAFLGSLVVFAFLALSLTQPTSLIMTVVVPFFAALGILIPVTARESRLETP